MSAGEVSKHAAWNVIGQIAPLIFAFIALPILLRRLGLDRYGFLTLVWVLVGYVGVFDFGVGRAVTRVVAKRLGENDLVGAEQSARAALSFLLCAGAVLACLLMAFAPVVVRLISLPEGLRAEGLNALRILALSLPLVLLTSGYRGYLEARRAFGVLNLIRVGMGVLTYLAPLFATLVSARLESMVISVVIMRALANYAHRQACIAQPGADLRLARVPLEHIRPLISLGGWISVSNVVSPLMGALDRLLIGPLVPIAAIGMYATGYDMITKVLILAYSLTGAAFPLFAGLTDPQHARALYATFVKVMLLSVWPVLFLSALFAKPVFSLWMGPDFAVLAGPAVQILAVGLLYNCLAQMPAMLIQSRGSPKWMALLHLIEMPIFLVVIYWLTSRYGVLGTATAWSLRVGLDALVLFAIVSRRLAHGALGLWAGLALLLVAPLAMLFPQLDLNQATRLTTGAVMVCVFLAAGWTLLLNARERTQFSGLVLMRLGKAFK